MMTKELAKADLSLARCWEGHVNALVLLDHLGNAVQKARWFAGVMGRGERWVIWSGAPQTRAPGEPVRFGTTVEPVAGGYVVNGTKVFSTSAGGAQWAILMVNPEGPGRARHGTASPESLLLLACDLSDPSVTTDTAWWDPLGMRASVSHLVRFQQTFIPDAHLIGAPGQYFRDGWQPCFTPHFAASFLGAAEAAYTFACEYLTAQGKREDPYVHHHMGHMAINVETGHLWLRHVARLWETGQFDEAKLAGLRALYSIEQIAEETVTHGIRACGARCLNRPSALERIYRDLSFYVLHDNADSMLATIGKQQLGQAHDASFFRA